MLRKVFVNQQIFLLMETKAFETNWLKDRLKDANRINMGIL
jgi:hypothetical protein